MIGSSSSPISDPLYNEIAELGFEKDMILLAMKFSNNKEDIINMIVRMLEDNDFYLQMKQSVNNVSSMSTQLIPASSMPYQLDQYKMVIIVREDLNMSKGKIAAQVGHAVLGAYKESLRRNPAIVNGWENYSGQAKIVVACKSEKELIDLMKKADENKIVTYIVRDAGRTEVEPNTCTCCAIGPNTVSEIDKITGKLSLLK